MIFLTAAEELGLSPQACFVVEDATSGVQAAKAGGMAAIGVARLGDEQQLADAGADLVVTTLDDVSLPALIEGRLEERQAAEEIRRRAHRAATGRMDTGVRRLRPRTRQGLREALCALGNGYFVTRGALPEAKADDVNYPGTYVAGLYNRLVSDVAGRQVENEDLVNVPNWLPPQLRISGGSPWFDVQQSGVEDHRLRAGYAPWNAHPQLLPGKTPKGRRTRVVQRRFVSRQDRTPGGPGDRVHQLRTGRAPSRSAPAWMAGLSTQASSATATSTANT